MGASAGLNLSLDRYRYQVGGQALGSSPVTITCELRGDTPAGRILGPMPELTSRLGIDRHPIDLADPAARAWLEAFIWPEHTDDLAVLRAAIEVAAVSAATVVPGDATTDTARLIGELPGREPVVVFTASLLSYLSADARRAFAAQLWQAAEHRPVAWVFAEGPGLVATADALLVPDGPLTQRNSLYLIGAGLRSSGRRDDALLGLADPYLRWIAQARNKSDDFQWLTESR